MATVDGTATPLWDYVTFLQELRAVWGETRGGNIWAKIAAHLLSTLGKTSSRNSKNDVLLWYCLIIHHVAVNEWHQIYPQEGAGQNQDVSIRKPKKVGKPKRGVLSGENCRNIWYLFLQATLVREKSLEWLLEEKMWERQDDRSGNVWKDEGRGRLEEGAWNWLQLI